MFRAHAAVANEIGGESMVENRFSPVAKRQAGRFRQRGVQQVIERIAGFFVPEEVVRLKRLGIVQRLLEVEAAVGIHRQRLPIADDSQHRLNPPLDRHPANRRRS